MKRLELVAYTNKADVDEDDSRSLVKAFLEYGTNPGVIAHYERLDGRGGFIIQDALGEDDLERAYERTLVYSQFMDFEVFPITTMEDALPTIMKLYG